MRAIFVVFITILSISSALQAQPAQPVGTLETQQYRVIIAIKQAKPVYTVLDKQGRELAQELDREALFAEFPGLQKLVLEGMASDASLERGKHTTGGLVND